MKRIWQELGRIDSNLREFGGLLQSFGREQQHMQEMEADLPLREIGRLDGRIDELTQVVTMALVNRPAAE